MPAPMSPKNSARRLLAGHPEIRGDDPPSALDDRIGEADLAVELERPCLHGKRARGRPRFRRLVDDPHAHAQPRQPQGQHQTGRACADDEDVGIANRRCIHGLESFSNLVQADEKLRFGIVLV